jgi:hypothetical protein
VLLDHVGDFPRFGGVTAQTIGAKLGLVHVGVARSTPICRTREFKILVTTCAPYSFVHAVEDETGLSMVEIGVRAHTPGICRMTGLTRYLNVAVRRLLGSTEVNTQQCCPKDQYDFARQ